jgi:hypothetical protein
MSYERNCHDNTVAENFFNLLTPTEYCVKKLKTHAKTRQGMLLLIEFKQQLILLAMGD